MDAGAIVICNLPRAASRRAPRICSATSGHDLCEPSCRAQEHRWQAAHVPSYAGRIPIVRHRALCANSFRGAQVRAHAHLGNQISTRFPYPCAPRMFGNAGRSLPPLRPAKRRILAEQIGLGTSDALLILQFTHGPEFAARARLPRSGLSSRLADPTAAQPPSLSRQRYGFGGRALK